MMVDLHRIELAETLMAGFGIRMMKEIILVLETDMLTSESLILKMVIINRRLLMDLRIIFGLTLTVMGSCTISSVTFAHLSQAKEEKELIERPELYIKWCDPDRASEAIGDINCTDYMRFFEPPYIERSF